MKWGVRRNRNNSKNSGKSSKTTFKQRRKMWNDLQDKKTKAYSKSFSKNADDDKATKAAKKVVDNFIKKNGKETYKKMKRDQAFLEAVSVGAMMAGTVAGYKVSQIYANKKTKKYITDSLNETLNRYKKSLR